jgi:hypothetical protein
MDIVLVSFGVRFMEFTHYTTILRNCIRCRILSNAYSNLFVIFGQCKIIEPIFGLKNRKQVGSQSRSVQVSRHGDRATNDRFACLLGRLRLPKAQSIGE